MRADELELLFRRQPCPLLRLHLTSGMTFEIHDPDQVVVTRSTLQLLLPAEGFQEREAVISLLHIVWIEVVARPE